MRYRILVFNIGGLSVKDKRFETLVNLILELSPDIIFLQEVRIFPNEENILLLLKKKLNFMFYNYTEAFDFSKDYGKGVLQSAPIKEGLGILSKYKFESFVKKLPIIKGIDRWPRVAVRYNINGLGICNVHLSKYESSRKLEMKELPKADIYLGDFNMIPEEILRFFPDDIISYNIKKYVSYPSKNLTLDYIILKKGKFIAVKSIDKGISDHSAIFAIIEI